MLIGLNFIMLHVPDVEQARVPTGTERLNFYTAVFDQVDVVVLRPVRIKVLLRRKPNDFR